MSNDETHADVNARNGRPIAPPSVDFSAPERRWPDDIVGESFKLRGVLNLVAQVARTDATVLICGETGTGKELVARAIHTSSGRCGGAFARVNCAAIPAGLMESELFGHERGAFTGATSRRVGRFELADDGTMFLDEVGELPLELQPKLLRLLQEREFERLGSNETLRSNARLVAATHRDLRALVDERSFREDLYYRLNVFPIHVPPLRERADDIPLLVNSFVRRFSRAMHKDIHSVCPATLAQLQRYDWPGNIRELQNVVERAVILCTGPVLDLQLDADMLRKRATRDDSETLEDVARGHILETLRKTNGVVGGRNGAAARLGMKRSTLNFRMKKLGIKNPYRPDDVAPPDDEEER
jgi:formate hydrogenlyase transcriptional activator